MGKIDRIGEEKTNNFGSLMRIKEYRGRRDMDVYFPEYNWTKEHATYDNFKKGNIKCPYEKRTFNVGYLGEGKYKYSENGKHTKCYKTWLKMLYRAYSPKYMQEHPTYIECEVHSSWHNFQVFAEWYYDNFYQIEKEQMELDKDILCKGNKIYSTDTCVFVPHRINTLFTKSDNKRGDCPIGVTYNKPGKIYETYCGMNGKRKYLGCYKTPEKAFEVYKQYKEKYIKQIAEEYKDKIPEKLYNAMYKYEVEIDD